MKGILVGTVLVVFAATTAFAGHSGGHAGSPGGGGGHAVPRSSGGHAYGGGGGHGSYGHGSYGHGSYGHGSYGHGSYGHGSYGHGSYGHGSYGHGYYGHGHYGHGYYGHGYYGYGYPYYGYYGSYPWLSLGFSWGGSYGYGAPYYAPSSGYGYYPAAGDSYAAEPPAANVDAPSDERTEDVRGSGNLRLDVRPDDASVYVDDRFLGSARELRPLALPPGPHRVEVVRPGFRTVERTVQVRPDAPATVVFELTRQ